MRHRLPRGAWITLSTVKVATAVAIVTAGIATAPSEPPTAGDAGLPSRSGHSSPSNYTSYAVALLQTRADQLFDAHRCSPTGFDDGSQPLSAVVRTARGRLRFVDFETGWQVYTQHGADTLMAVCLDDPPS